MSNSSRPAAAVLLAALSVVACSGTAAPTTAPSGSPEATASPPTPTSAGIQHPTGANEIVLRFDEAGGFVPAEFFAAHVPYFTLYGDGTVVFVRTAGQVDPAPHGIGRSLPLRTGHLDETKVQELLEFALGDGGLAIAKAEYNNPLVADAPTAVFEIHADQGDKTVSVVALGMDGDPGPDTAVKAALAHLGDRLRDFDKGGTLSSAPFAPVAYRAVLTDATGGGGVGRPWPWSSLTMKDFTFPADPSALKQGTRVMTPDEIAALGVDGLESGVQSGLFVTAPDGGMYSLVVRPLLPDEKS